MERPTSELTPDDRSKPAGRNYGTSVVRLFIAGGIGFALYFILGFFDTSTELTPTHDNLDTLCFIMAGLCGLVFAITILVSPLGISRLKRYWAAFLFLFLGVLVGFMVTFRAIDIVEGLIDFPSGKTTTSNNLIRISRAYQTHGKGRSWDIQTMPLWSNLDIEESDYNFMLAHRAPGDSGHNPDEITSHGYFCAKVTIQRSGDAIRILHAGSQTLPAGTVIICP